ncbi:MAG: hypothetical protein CSB55_01925 [Candidatus Cloacimonadota bacterium]|nr:MAG: hypothetical protein CSB55_01925 [Candidatus Cloacimonadota bacterium]
MRPVNFTAISRSKPSWRVFLKIFYKIILFVFCCTALIGLLTFFLARFFEIGDFIYFIALVLTLIINGLFIYGMILKLFALWKEDCPEM